MITPEQINNLKPGDPLIIHGTYMRQYSNGDIVIKCNMTRSGGELGIDEKYLHPLCVSLPSEHGTSVPTPKYDPTRLFKEGDKVRYCERDGRKLFRLQDGAIYEVKSNEGDAGTVEIWLWKEFGRYESYPYNVFELVTPVEEPYSVQETMSHDGWQIVRDGLPLAIYDSRRHPNAKAAAEAERDRLNAEHRKEQSNG